MDDGLYVSALRRRRKRRRVGTAIAAAALVAGAGAYVATAWAMNRSSQVSGVAPLAPLLSPSASAASALPLPSVTAASVPAPPTPGPPPGTMSAARRSWRPSPVPSPSGLTDAELAAQQVSRLLTPRSLAPGQAMADDAAIVRNELTPDGTQLRIVSARTDLTDTLGAADAGQPIGAARCTQTFRLDDVPSPQVRPGLLVCWRMSAAKSVVVVATSTSGRPAPAVGESVIRREWLSMG
ncbi:hypothetical protein ACQP2F_35915 [Actinoplanes sp. CA-030573]|uniref:hypothetical protein n=1 Tax=Actinoplanes sp. CA-030573 TaxID=3239898 RepID=UPI003D8ABDD9